MKTFILSVVIFFFVNCPGFSHPGVGDAPQEMEGQFVPAGVGVKVEVWIENLDIPLLNRVVRFRDLGDREFSTGSSLIASKR
jgi:hypothetical protein